jgi:hypothetical protein
MTIKMHRRNVAKRYIALGRVSSGSPPFREQFPRRTPTPASSEAIERPGWSEPRELPNLPAPRRATARTISTPSAGRGDYERAAMRWLERYHLTESFGRYQHSPRDLSPRALAKRDADGQFAASHRRDVTSNLPALRLSASAADDCGTSADDDYDRRLYLGPEHRRSKSEAPGKRSQSSCSACKTARVVVASHTGPLRRGPTLPRAHRVPDPIFVLTE